MSLPLSGKFAIVTGASRGIGKGIALQLCQAGCTVFITGRKPENSLSSKLTYLSTLQETAQDCRDRGGKCLPFYVDHSDIKEVEKFFQKVAEITGNKLDILVNNVFSAVTNCGSGDTRKFFEKDPELWNDINNVGLQNHYYCNVYASRIMIQNPNDQCLLVNVSSIGGILYLFNTAYGVGKIAKDRMAADMGVELKDTNISAISLWPGAVRTELIMHMLETSDGNWGSEQNKMFWEGESTEFPGKCIVAIFNDRNMKGWNSSTVITADIGNYYKFRDIDGRKPANLREFKSLLNLTGHTTLASWIPSWVMLPGWMIAVWQNKINY
ncbi:unnamed protein product [Caenorhabditis angaria]|uniref:Uncharacterized protein n=1 Tax=Caenorhabditis angaria TaxID=860376 RepID=A0A9P1J2S2_9PELO|nr:unnamed protein product [Caenorhabditis angaria]